MIAGLEAERAKQLRALVRQLIEFAIADRLAAARHPVGDLVRLGAGVDGGMGHGILQMANGEWRMANRDEADRPLTCSASLLANRYSPPYSLSTIVTFAMPPPSHMVCRP